MVAPIRVQRWVIFGGTNMTYLDVVALSRILSSATWPMVAPIRVQRFYADTLRCVTCVHILFHFSKEATLLSVSQNREEIDQF
jgi:hypothetical protein